jgi:predicted O-methyltransferase YrrM
MEAIYQTVKKNFVEEIESGSVDILRGKFQDVMHDIESKSLDFAYIDGDHRFEGVLQDLEMCADKVKVRGLVVLDDHQLGGWWGEGVVRALNTFLGNHPADWRVRFVSQNQVGILKLQ